jgi:SAM-dependent methyltransferase
MKASDFNEPFVEIKSCRTCLSKELVIILDLGLHPLANSLLSNASEPEMLVPLILIRCESCTTIQLSVNVNPELMFQNYLWVTGTTDTARGHCSNLAELIIQKSAASKVRVLEIGSNDGTLLEALVEKGATEVIGVDPASNLQPNHLNGPVKLVEGFFSKDLATDILHTLGQVDVIVARNVLSHVPNLNNVMLGIDALVCEKGIVVIEFHDAYKILTELHYESIYHEHTFYHSIRSVQAALDQIGFKIFDITLSPISGGSNVIYASRERKEISPSLQNALKAEESKGVYSKESWENFARLSRENIGNLREMFELEKDSKWIAFGASARSSTLLNSVGLTAKYLSKIADNNPLKQNKFSPGLKLPIVDPKDAIDSSVQKIFICAFNFEHEIIELLKTELNWHGEIVLPLPMKIRRYEI